MTLSARKFCGNGTCLCRFKPFLDMEKLQPELPERENSLKILTEYLGEESSAVYFGSGIKLLEVASREQEIRTVLRSVKNFAARNKKQRNSYFDKGFFVLCRFAQFKR